jgi:hypothetical protein
VDFQLYGRVLWRFRLIVAAGLILAVAAAGLSVIRVSSSGVSYRQTEVWSSTARLGVTQYGFPWGRLFAQSPVTGTEGKDQIPVANPDRFNALAVLYAELATSDPVRRLMLRRGVMRGEIIATALRDSESGTQLPLIEMTGLAESPQEAVALTSRGVLALQTYLEEEQRSNGVPALDRVVLQEVVEPTEAEVFQPRSKTMPVVIFLAVMFATVALAFLLENLRPRYKEVKELDEPPVARPAHRRTA